MWLQNEAPFSIFLARNHIQVNRDSGLGCDAIEPTSLPPWGLEEIW